MTTIGAAHYLFLPFIKKNCSYRDLLSTCAVNNNVCIVVYGGVVAVLIPGWRRDKVGRAISFMDQLLLVGGRRVWMTQPNKRYYLPYIFSLISAHTLHQLSQSQVMKAKWLLIPKLRPLPTSHLLQNGQMDWRGQMCWWTSEFQSGRSSSNNGLLQGPRLTHLRNDSSNDPLDPSCQIWMLGERWSVRYWKQGRGLPVTNMGPITRLSALSKSWLNSLNPWLYCKCQYLHLKPGSTSLVPPRREQIHTIWPVHSLKDSWYCNDKFRC